MLPCFPPAGNIDATTLEANAALRSIVRRDSGEGYDEFLKGLAQASGIETPTRQELVKLDRKRKKKGSNQEWKHPHDPDARITKMKDGQHLAHKAERWIWRGAIVAVTVQGADQGDTTTMVPTLIEAAENLKTINLLDAPCTPRIGIAIFMRMRGERLERPFAHLYRTGGLRRTEVRGHSNETRISIVRIDSSQCIGKKARSTPTGLTSVDARNSNA